MQQPCLRTLPLAEVSFLQLMLRHHQGGVFMAAQQNEIGLMREVLALRGAQPLPDLQRMSH